MKKMAIATGKIVTILKQAEMGLAVADPIRQIAISEQTFCSLKMLNGETNHEAQ